MRRVDVSVRLFSATDTYVEDVREKVERKSGATRNWEIWVTGEAGVDLGPKASAILITLRNTKTRQRGTYAGWTSGAGASVGVSISKTSLPSWDSFRVPTPMYFRDFSGATFTITSFGAGIGAVGGEYSILHFQRYVGGHGVPAGIHMAGLSFGGVGINLGSITYGTMFLIDSPSETYAEAVRTEKLRVSRSESEVASAHRVFFKTGSADVVGAEGQRLGEYLSNAISEAF